MQLSFNCADSLWRIFHFVVMPPSEGKRHESSIGIKYPKHRDSPYKNVDLWLKDKRDDDGAEGLWRIHDKLYNLTEFILSHPGGQDWITSTKVNTVSFYCITQY